MFVPAAWATLPIFEKIFSRAGAEDNLGNAESTFTKQMVETSYILNHPLLSKSLVLFDELGSNTNERQGKAIAAAIINNCVTKGATVFLATHFDLVFLKKHVAEIQAVSITAEHNLLPFDNKYRSNGWDFCRQRGFIQ